ncbi:MAG TPA: glycosyltransferase family 2 protein [Candidatus Kapabacteria bacterium]|nr:glycosyltransferase family 2 protein [Candidatus Kapabacteria bacterium]
MLFDLIIINYNTPQLTIDCVNSALDTFKESEFNIIIIDNNSTDNSVQIFRQRLKNVIVVETKKSLSYAGALNEGAKYSKSNLLILSNSDIVFLDNSIKNLIAPIMNDEADITGAQLLYSNMSWQASYHIFPGFILGLTDLFFINTIKRNLARKFYRIAKHSQKKYKSVDYIDGAILAVNKTIFEQVGGFDTDFAFYSEETAFCYKAMKLGARIYHIPSSVLIHYRGASYSMEKIPLSYLEKSIYSKLLFCNKFLSKFETKVFLVCEKYHFLSLHLLSRFYQHNDSKYGDNYYDIYKIWSKIIHEN